MDQHEELNLRKKGCKGKGRDLQARIAGEPLLAERQIRNVDRIRLHFKIEAQCNEDVRELTGREEEARRTRDRNSRRDSSSVANKF